jgi:hypothetical protein
MKIFAIKYGDNDMLIGLLKNQNSAEVPPGDRFVHHQCLLSRFIT